MDSTPFLFYYMMNCDVETNPKWALSYIDDILDAVEHNADEDDYRRLLRADFFLPPNPQDSDYVEKRNRVFEALRDFLLLLKQREEDKPPCQCSECAEFQDRQTKNQQDTA